jgi:exosortase H (IPTLxxWG-CTERM-specific)
MTKEDKRSGRISAWLVRKREKKPVFYFCMVFCAVLMTISILLRLDFFQTHLLTPHLKQIAVLCSTAIHTLGTSCDVSDTSILSDKFSINIVPGCDSIYPTALLWAALIAYPATWKSKLLGMAGGTVVLFIINILRVLSMFYVGRAFPSLFEFVHVYAWQALFILLTLALWLLWAVKVAREKIPVRS